MTPRVPIGTGEPPFGSDDLSTAPHSKTSYQRNKHLFDHWLGIITAFGVLATPREVAQRASDFWWGMAPPIVQEAMRPYRTLGSKIAAIAFPGKEVLNRWMEINPHIARFCNEPARAHEFWQKQTTLEGEIARLNSDPKKLKEFLDNPKYSHGITKFNNCIYTHNEDGTLNHITSDTLRPLFKEGHEADWPQLLLTSNHARTDGSEDIASIMDNFASFTSHAVHAAKGHFDLLRLRNGEPNALPHAAQNVRGKTIAISAIYTQPTSEGNGAATIYRYNYLRDHPNASLEERMVPSVTGNEKFACTEEATLRGPSPAAIRLAKLILKLMIENPYDLQVDSDSSFVDETRPLKTLLQQRLIGEKPILRADADKIAEHIMLEGFSMGTATTSDALRYLAFELSSKDAQGEPIFQRRTAADDVVALTAPRGVADIISKIGLIGVGGPTLPLTEEERQLGMNRITINSVHDLISYHFIVSGFTKSNAHHFDPHTLVLPNEDQLYAINAQAHENLGHDPTEALGLGGRRGFILDDHDAMASVMKLLGRRYQIPGHEAGMTSRVA